MEGAKVVIVEDHRDIRDFIRRYLERGNHLVTREAATLGEAFTAIDDIDEGRLECDVLCVDGSLGSGNMGAEDGRAVVEDARHRNLPVTIIGLSNYLLRTDFGVDVDFEIEKPNLHKLVETVDSLPDRAP
jgi:DNA-binding response OmpR family regulator